jgi:hypothetical protein
MGRYAHYLIHRSSTTSLIPSNNTSRGESIRNNILKSLNLVQHFHNFRRKQSFVKILDGQLVGVDVDDGDSGQTSSKTIKANVDALLEEQVVFKDFENKSLSIIMSGFEDEMFDISNVKILQTLTISKGDVNSVAFSRRNFILATGSG